MSTCLHDLEVHLRLTAKCQCSRNRKTRDSGWTRSSKVCRWIRKFPNARSWRPIIPKGRRPVWLSQGAGIPDTRSCRPPGERPAQGHTRSRILALTPQKPLSAPLGAGTGIGALRGERPTAAFTDLWVERWDVIPVGQKLTTLRELEQTLSDGDHGCRSAMRFAIETTFGSSHVSGAGSG